MGQIFISDSFTWVPWIWSWIFRILYGGVCSVVSYPSTLQGPRSRPYYYCLFFWLKSDAMQCFTHYNKITRFDTKNYSESLTMNLHNYAIIILTSEFRNNNYDRTQFLIGYLLPNLFLQNNSRKKTCFTLCHLRIR